jgi:dTDP-4-dehydrorhamnose 3,5-epimerase
MPYTAFPTSLPEVSILEPKVFGDARGFFYESFNAREFRRVTGQDGGFVQDNHSRSSKGVLRGLHYQIEHAQGKLVRVTSGQVLDVAVDIRKSSPHFGQWAAVLLSQENKRQLWIPPGFAHGFLVVSDTAEFLYKTTDYWHPEHERTVKWDDSDLAIDWQLERIAPAAPLLSAKDAQGVAFAAAETFA